MRRGRGVPDSCCLCSSNRCSGLPLHEAGWPLPAVPAANRAEIICSASKVLLVRRWSPLGPRVCSAVVACKGRNRTAVGPEQCLRFSPRCRSIPPTARRRLLPRFPVATEVPSRGPEVSSVVCRRRDPMSYELRAAWVHFCGSVGRAFSLQRALGGPSLLRYPHFEPFPCSAAVVAENNRPNRLLTYTPVLSRTRPVLPFYSRPLWICQCATGNQILRCCRRT